MTGNDMNPTPYAASERRTLLDAYFEALERMRAADSGSPEAKKAEEEATQEVSRLWDEYVAGTPKPALSRCPFSQEIVHHSIDPFGLDGLWWCYDTPARPIEELPVTFFAFVGALKLGPDLEEVPFLCKPGPEVPFVVPRMLERPEVRAVISSIPVGGHTGFAIFYFANPIPSDVERANTWGTDLYRFETLDGDTAWFSCDWEPEDFDFDLERWIRAGKLLWIGPDDPDMRLRDDPDGCPYLGLQGRRVPMNIQGTDVWDGVIWSEEELEQALLATAALEPQEVRPPEEPEPEAPVEATEPAPQTPEAGPRFCRECGSELREGAKFCASCGTPVQNA